jgi:hypothetical protein
MKNLITAAVFTLVFVANSNACVMGKSGQLICAGETVNINGINGVVTDANVASGIVTLTMDPAEINTFSECRVPPPNLGNPHRNYDAKFRACRIKATTLGFPGDQARTCQAICMKN